MHLFLHSSPFFYPNPKIICSTMLFNGPDTPQNCPLLVGIWTPFKYIPWTEPSPHPKRHLNLFSHFLHRSRQQVPMLYNGPTLSSQNFPLHGGSGPHLIYGSLAHPNPQTKWTDRPTDRPNYSVCNNRPHLRTAMWPNNNNTNKQTVIMTNSKSSNMINTMSMSVGCRHSMLKNTRSLLTKVGDFIFQLNPSVNQSFQLNLKSYQKVWF